MKQHKQTLIMVQTPYIKIFTVFLGLAISSLANAKEISAHSSFFQENFQSLKANLLRNQSLVIPEICDNGIDDDGDGLIDCFDPDCSATCITGNLSRSFVSSSSNYGFFSYDPDPTCASEDWELDWTKFQAPEWFHMEEYDDGSFIMHGTIVSLTDSNDSWDVWIRLHNKRSWAEWSALGRMFYEPSTGGNCSANHTTWDYYETDETASRWFGTPGSANDGKVVTIGHNPTDFSKGVQVGFGANNCETCSCSSFNVRGWYNMSGDLTLPCGDYGSVMSGYETANECNVYNGDFEDGLDYWDTYGGVAITNDAALGNSAGVINADNGTLSQIFLPAIPDNSYIANIWAKVANAPNSAVLVMEFYDNLFNPLERYATEVSNTTYQTYTLGAVAPSNSAYVSIWGWKGTGGEFYLDELCLEIDENYTESNCQDILNGGFEDGTVTAWNPWGTVTATSSANAGNYAALIYGSDGGIDQTLNVIADETYNFETYIRETNIDGNTSYGISWLDAGGTVIYSFWQSLFTANYEKYQLLGKAPSNATQARLWVTKTGNGELYIDDNCFKIFERRPPTEDCTNGIDDDGDGLIDCFDPDCGAPISNVIELDFEANLPPTLESGNAQSENAVYRFTGVAVGIDALLTIRNIHNVDNIERMFAYGLSHRIRGVAANNPHINYAVQLVNTGTNTLAPPIDFILSAFDIDGIGDSAKPFSDYISMENITGFYALSEDTRLIDTYLGNNDYNFSVGQIGSIYPDDPGLNNPSYGVGVVYSAVNSFSYEMGFSGTYSSDDDARTIIMKGVTSELQNFNTIECSAVEICDNGIDDDGDGLVDCADPDCSAEVSLSATTATACGQDITVSVNQCITYANVLADIVGNVTNANVAIDGPDDMGAFLNSAIGTDTTYTRMVWDFGEVIPNGEEVCFRVRNSSTTVSSNVTIWVLNSGTPQTGSYDIVTNQSFVGTDWQDLCVIMPKASQYVKITDDGGEPFYIDAVGRKCRDVNNLSYVWNTGETTPSISVNGALSTTYSVSVTSPGACTASENIAVLGFSGCPEICNNGRDDDGDGFIDSGDSDCTSDCNESLLFVARDNAQILQVNLNTGATSIAGSSPYTNENLNAMAANPDAGIVYYGHGKTVYHWNPATGNHGVLIDLTGQVGTNEILTSGGGAYFDNQLYLGFEDDLYSDYPTIYRISLAADGLSTTGTATNLNVPIPDNTSWGDMIVSAENGKTVIYAGLGYNGNIFSSLYFKYIIEDDNYITIRTDMPEALQIGVDVNGNLWGGGLATGTIQQMDKVTGDFFGPPIYIGGDMWDLTGPINCPQQVEICGNGMDDDGDGRIDSDDEDCDCPIIATTDNKNMGICTGDEVTFNIVTNASNLPFDEIELYSFSTAQTNPYTATGDEKTLIGKFDNTAGMGAITSDNFVIQNGSSTNYYVYAMLSPTPSDLTDCAPFLEYIVSVDPCQEIEVNCIEGRTIETYFSGINNDVPKTLSFSGLEDIDSIFVQIVYENNSPGNTISITNSDGDVFSFQRFIKNDIHLFEGIIPPTTSITYTNEAIKNEAQSIVAYVYKSNQPGGAFARYSVAVSGHANTRDIDFPLPDRVESQNVTINLPLSELTYDNRVLHFTVTAGAYTNTFTKRWGPNGDNFPGSCCLDFVEITLPNLPATVDNINVEITSPGNATGQSYIVAGTVFLEIDCYDDEDCTDGIDNDNDGNIDQQDLDCSGYCSDNGTFLPYGMLTLDNFSGMTGLYSEQYNLTFDVSNTAYLYWTSGNRFVLKGTVVAYQEGNYIGKYALTYTAIGAEYTTYSGDNILGSSGGYGKLVSYEPNLTANDEILLDAKLNANGFGLMVREYAPNDIRLEGDWGFASWNSNNTISLSVNTADCQAPKEICGNGEDDDNDGLVDCADSDCENPNNSGTITGNESNCGIYTPTIINIQTIPSGGGSGIPEYQWEKSTGNNIWMDVIGAIQATYTPTIITQTTNYRRKIRMGSCNPWLTSNTITKTVTPSPFDAEIVNAPNGENDFLCNSESYVFQAAAVDDAIYAWDFGDYANPSSATGIGPHDVVFNTPTGNLPIGTEVLLRVVGTTGALCVAADTLPINIRPLSNVATINHEDPSLCGASDGWIILTTSGEIGGCVEVSLDGGINYEPEGQVEFRDLAAGSYEVVTRYCDNGCPNIAEIVTLSDPATINLVNDDFLNVCPGFNYSSNVFINDDIKGETTLSLASNGSFGTVVLEDNGDFVYTPHTPTCDMDQFAYTVCDPGMNCCATAVVTIDFNDDEAPVLINVPDDLTINCDEEIPLPPLVTASDNCPAISIDKEETNTQGEEGCSLYDYSVTYKWIASDFCGNEAIDSQRIFIKDQTAPDIYRIYTLPNGKKLVAGVMENVTNLWKVVQLPIEFDTRPLVFSQVVTSNVDSATVVRMRNISATQFEVKLQEQATNDNQITGESVAWFAIEAGTQVSDYQLDASIFSVGNAVRNISFQNGFTQTPAFFTSIQSVLDLDPVYPRNDNLSSTGVSVNLQEETSLDSDVTHDQEKLAYLAIDTSILSNQRGDVFGESGKIMANDTWQTIELSNTYTNPVIVANISSLNEVDPVIVQVNNVTSERFDIRLKEWDYLDGNHGSEAVSFIVIEGSLPLSSERFCDYGTDSLVLGVDIVAVDNCDQNVTISYEEVESFSGPRQIFSRIWSAIDECGNETVYAQDVLCEGVYVRIKAMLQGATLYNDDGLMRDDLRRKGLIPLMEPYSDNPNFKHIGGGGESMDEAMMATTGPDACVDWVFIELCDGNDIANVVATHSAIIQKDGDVTTADGDTLIRFENVPPGDYYVSLSHRNHLKTISLSPYTFTPNGVPTVNFMDEFTPVIGNEPNIDLGKGKKALWSGDLNGDARIIYQGPKNDVFDMFLHVILDSINGHFLTNFISSGYTDKDFNMDGTVIFQGPNNDKSNMLFNTILKHPSNPENFSNFIIATHAQSQILNGNNPDGTTPGFDFDNDGIMDGIDSDDDNDGVADGNDLDSNNSDSDSDGDGITDDIETGGDGHYDYLIDSDPLNPCSPNISSLCVGIDIDEDGYFRNYPTTHPQYDAYDENACLPDFNNANCYCTNANHFLDKENKIFVKICHKDEFGNSQTIQISLSALPAHLEHGDVCGPCNE